MPRKTKETNEITKPSKVAKATDIAKKVASSSSKAKKPTSTKTSTKKKDVALKSGSQKTTVAKKSTKTTSAKTTDKNSTKITAKKTSTKATSKKTSAKTTSKKTATKATNKKTTTKKSTTSKKKTTTSKKAKVDVVEYYDLPYRYNQTVVKILAQTPTNLFIYWDISDEDRENFKKTYGENFFEVTKPVLIIHNITMNYSFEIDINDFANSWYLHVNDAKCDYKIELGRRPIIHSPKIQTDYIYISTSNEIESPNNRILFSKEQKVVSFRNVKTGVQTERPISKHFSFVKNMSKIYNIYDIYKAIYENENIEEIYDLSNPASGGNPSSGTFSSRFK